MSSGRARLATWIAAATASPPEPPIRIPSVRLTRRAVWKLSSSLMAITSSYSSGSQAAGKKSSPTPSTRYGPTRAAGEHRALGIGGDDPDRRVLLLQVPGRAGDRAARAGAGDEVGDPPGGLPPDLGPGGLGVGERVVGVGVLVGAEGVALVGQPLGDLVVALRIVGRHGHRAHDHLGAVGLQQRDLLGRHLVGHHEHALVAALAGDDRQADAGVAAGRLDDRAARLQQARRARRRGSSRAPAGPSTSRPGWWSPSSSPARREADRSPSCASSAPAACCRSGRSPTRRSRSPPAERQPWAEANRAAPDRRSARRASGQRRGRAGRR